MTYAVWIGEEDITSGPGFDCSEGEAILMASAYASQGYRIVNTAYCMLARIDCDNWLDILAAAQNRPVTAFCDPGTTDVSDHWHGVYLSHYSHDVITVCPAIIRKMRLARSK